MSAGVTIKGKQETGKQVQVVSNFVQESVKDKCFVQPEWMPQAQALNEIR